MSAFLLLLTLAIVLVLAGVVRANLRNVTVFEYERGLRYARGRFVGVLGPGQYWLWSLTTAVRKVDVRARVVPIAGQEVLSADGVAIKVSLAATYRIADPVRAINAVESYETALYTALQLALRTVVSGRSAEEIFAHRASLGPEILGQASASVRELGLELLEADLKDLTLPGELKKIFAQVVRASGRTGGAGEGARRDGRTAEPRERGADGRAQPAPHAAATPPSARRALGQHGRSRRPERRRADPGPRRGGYRAAAAGGPERRGVIPATSIRTARTAA